ncbi:uncharacterized protein LOC112494039 isoform X2 [Cephus cinctus]|uniref:Uncharacterized protein LOC112494039 isoform X2 n=1 Tax=Cephus cinctus TaxID=211228 RepID=A0AAJ7RCU6_CEPCN|nr:uncharacterized protein LOC112494039 isoform X2 [Cephus cinctus]
METKCEVKTTVGIDLFKSKFQRLSNVYIVSLIDTLQLPELFIPWKLQEIDDPRNATFAQQEKEYYSTSFLKHIDMHDSILHNTRIQCIQRESIASSNKQDKV